MIISFFIVYPWLRILYSTYNFEKFFNDYLLALEFVLDCYKTQEKTRTKDLYAYNYRLGCYKTQECLKTLLISIFLHWNLSPIVIKLKRYLKKFFILSFYIEICFWLVCHTEIWYNLSLFTFFLLLFLFTIL